MVIGLGIPFYKNPSDAKLLALHHPYLNIDGVIFDTGFHGHRLERQVTVVLIQGTEVHPLRIHKYPGFQAFQTVGVAPANAQDGIQLRTAVLGIPGKRNLPEVKLVAFIDLKRNPNIAISKAVNRIRDHARISVPLSVV